MLKKYLLKIKLKSYFVSAKNIFLKLMLLLTLPFKNYTVLINEVKRLGTGNVKWHYKLLFKEQDSILKLALKRIIKLTNLEIPDFVPRKENVLYLASTIYNSGGHTRVMYDFISHHSDVFNLFVYLTEIESNHKSENTLMYQSVKHYVKGFKVDSANNEVISKMNNLISFIVSNEISTIIMFEHAWDLVAVVSMMKLKQFNNVKVIYYHHQNTHLSLCPDFMDVYIEISDDLLPKINTLYSNIHFMQIPAVHINNDIVIKEYSYTKELKFLTAIPFPKMFKNSTLVFPDLVIKMLKFFPNSYYTIVTNYNEKLIFLLSEYFNEHGVGSRVEIKHSIYKLYELQDTYNIYIDSLPVGGGKTFIEMIQLKRPCITIEPKGCLIKQNNIFNNMKVKNDEELFFLINHLNTDKNYREQYVKNAISIVDNELNPQKLTKELESLICS